MAILKGTDIFIQQAIETCEKGKASLLVSSIQKALESLRN